MGLKPSDIFVSDGSKCDIGRLQVAAQASLALSSCRLYFCVLAMMFCYNRAESLVRAVVRCHCIVLVNLVKGQPLQDKFHKDKAVTPYTSVHKQLCYVVRKSLEPCT